MTFLIGQVLNWKPSPTTLVTTKLVWHISESGRIMHNKHVYNHKSTIQRSNFIQSSAVLQKWRHSCLQDIWRLRFEFSISQNAWKQLIVLISLNKIYPLSVECFNYSIFSWEYTQTLEQGYGKKKQAYQNCEDGLHLKFGQFSLNPLDALNLLSDHTNSFSDSVRTSCLCNELFR